jgi:peptide/nickel transport system permease protein
MTAYLARRGGQYLLVGLLALALNFALPRAMPGSPLSTLGGEDVGLLGAGSRAELLAQYGLDRPLHVQFTTYLADVARGDLGRSFARQRPVSELIAERLPWTLLLVGGSLVATTVLGVALGTMAGARRQRRRDTGTLSMFLALDALPSFWLGMLLILLFGVTLGWLPTFGAAPLRGAEGLGAQVVAGARHLALPLATLVVTGVGQTYLIVRYSMLSVLGSDHLFHARARGLPRRRIIVRHALRNAALPVHTLLLLEVGWLVGGAVVVETVFAYPGLGRLVFEAVQARDFPVLQGAFLVLTATVIAMNALADLTYPLLDPRLRRPAAEVAA